MFDQAIALDLTEVTAHLHRANALAELGRTDAAVIGYRRSLEIAPNLAVIWCNLGIAYRDLGALEEAFSYYDKALKIDPQFAAAHWNEALTRLLAGQFEVGLKKYEWRWRRVDAPAPRRESGEPPWLGESSIRGQTILLHAEQGFGDTIQFCRYATRLADQGADIILDVQPSLKSLMARSFPRFKVTSADALPPFRRHCPLMSLPLALSTELDSIPADIPYLYADSDAAAHWQRIIGAQHFKRVGIAWAGSPGHRNDRHRSIRFGQLPHLLAVPGVAWISLQKDVPTHDLAELQAAEAVRRLAEILVDFDQTAALISALDLVITVDTAIAHLAGALGKPVWILLPLIPDWRWLLGRNDSPWYPTARLFRQTVAGDWEGPLADVATALQHFA